MVCSQPAPVFSSIAACNMWEVWNSGAKWRLWQPTSLSIWLLKNVLVAFKQVNDHLKACDQSHLGSGRRRVTQARGRKSKFYCSILSGNVSPQQGLKNYWEKRRGDSLMLAMWWRTECAQHAALSLKFEKLGLFRHFWWWHFKRWKDLSTWL